MVTPPLAGMSENGICRFWLYDSVGTALWAATYGGVGMLFSRELNGISVIASRFSGVLAVALGIPLAVYMIWHTLTFIPVSRSLHLHSIRPDRLGERINNSDKTLTLDLLLYEDAEGIPSSVRMDPSKVRESHQILFPADLDVVLYCASPNHFRSTRGPLN